MQMSLKLNADDAERGLNAVLRDVRHSTGVEIFGWVTPTEGLTVSLNYDDSGSSTDLVDACYWRYERFVGVIADWVQTKIEFHLRQPWPACPRHPNHELSATAVEGYWVCPEDTEIRFHVGELP